MKLFYCLFLLLTTTGCSVTLGGQRSALYLPFDDRDAVIVINDGDGVLDILVNENVVREGLPPGRPYPVRVPCLNGMSNYRLLITVLVRNQEGGAIRETFSRVMSGYCNAYGRHYQRVEPWVVGYGFGRVQSRWLTPGAMP